MFDYDLMIVGGGPAGYVAAIRAAQKGMKTVVFEKQSMGGTCLNVGCIPTKALYQSARLAREIRRAGAYGLNVGEPAVDFPAVMARKEKVVAQLVGGVRHLMKKNKVTVIAAEVAFEDPHTLSDKAGKRYTGKNILLATGSRNSLPPVEGIRGDGVLDSTGALALKELPRRLAIVGGGTIGVELGDIYRAFGAEVTILEALPQLIRGADSSCADLLRRSLEKNGVRVELSASVKKIEGPAGCKRITFEQDGRTKTVEADAVLAATGRAPNTGDLRLEKAGVRTDRKGWIETDSHMRTSVPHIYAAGDVTGKSLFAHTAYEAGSTAVENMAGRDCEMRYDAVPQVVFASTEIAWTGLTEEAASKAGYKPVVGVFPLSANGKAIAEGETEGFVKVVSETEYHRVLGVHMAGPSASEMITTGVSLLAQEQGLEDVEATIYPHPSVSEAIREACLIAAGKALHS